MRVYEFYWNLVDAPNNKINVFLLHIKLQLHGTKKVREIAGRVVYRQWWDMLSFQRTWRMAILLENCRFSTKMQYPFPPFFAKLLSTLSTANCSYFLVSHNSLLVHFITANSFFFWYSILCIHSAERIYDIMLHSHILFYAKPSTPRKIIIKFCTRLFIV